MDNFAIYLLQVSSCWIGFYLLYFLFMRKETFFSFNRYYLLGSLGLGLIIPLIGKLLPANNASVEVYQAMATIGQEVVVGHYAATTVEKPFDWSLLFALIYQLGVFLVAIRLVAGLYRIFGHYRKGQKEVRSTFTLVHSDQYHLPFSFFRWIFISKKLPLKKEIEKVLKHEELHASQWHSLDVLFAEMLQVFFWFNPILIFYKKSLRQSHEYLADAYVTGSCERNSYGQLLLRQSSAGLEIALANQFFHSQIKKRITMMYQEKSKREARWKYLLAIPVLAVLVMVFSSNTLKQTEPLREKVVEILQDKTYQNNGDVAYQLGRLLESEIESSDNKGDKLVLIQQLAEDYYFDVKFKDNKVVQIQFDLTPFELVSKKDFKVYNLLLDRIELDKSVAVISPYAHELAKEYPKQEKLIRGVLNDFLSKGKINLKNITMGGNDTEATYNKSKTESEISIHSNGTSTSVGNEQEMNIFAEELTLSHNEKVDGHDGQLIVIDGKIQEADFRLKEFSAEVAVILNEAKATQKYGSAGKNGALEIYTSWDIEGAPERSKYSANIARDTIEEEVFKVVEEMPRFPGCEDLASLKEKDDCAKTKMLEFIYENLTYPAEAREASVEGMVVVKFVVDKSGVLRDFDLLRDIGNGCGEAAMAVVKAMNDLPEKWTPGKQRGKAVSVQYVLPVKFKLESEDAVTGANEALVVVNGTEVKPVKKDGKLPSERIRPEQIETINVLKGEKAIEKYGDKGKNGVIEITLKDKDLSAEEWHYIMTGQQAPLEEFYVLGDKAVDLKEWSQALKESKTDLRVFVKHPEWMVEKFGEAIEGKRVMLIPQEKESEEILQVAEKMPLFPGTETESESQTELLNFVGANVKYPEKAVLNDIEGMVVMSFVIDKEGQLGDIRLLRKVGWGLDEVSLEMADEMAELGKWTPAQNAGKPVALQYTLPIKFKLQSAQIEERRSKKLEVKTIQIRPNPNDGQFTLVAELPTADPSEVFIYNETGQLVKNLALSGKMINQSIDVSEVSGKSLFLNIVQNGQAYTEKIMLIK